MWAIIVFNTDPPPSSLDHLDAKAVGDFVLSSGLVRALVVALCGRCVAILHVVRALPHFRKVS